MPTVQEGTRTGLDLVEDLIVQEMVSRVAQLQPNARPFVTTMTYLKKVMPTDNPEPQHAEDELLPNQDETTATSTAADTGIDVANVAFYLVDDIVHVPRTGENMRVTALPGGGVITVVRGVGGPPAAIVVNEPLWILGGAQAEGQRSRVALNTLEVVKTFHMQIIRNSIDGTGTQLATRQHGGDFDDQFDKKLIEHKRQCDLFFKHGNGSRVDNGSGAYLRTMFGINSWVRTNRMGVDGVLGEGEFDAFLDMGFQYGNARKLFVCSPTVSRAINNFAKNRLVTVPKDESYGLAIREYESPAGIVEIVVDPELKGSTYGGYGMLVDPDYLVIRYLRAGPDGGRTDKYQGSMFCRRIENIQDNDSDTRKDEVFSEMGLQMIHERTAAVMTGVEG